MLVEGGETLDATSNIGSGQGGLWGKGARTTAAAVAVACVSGQRLHMQSCFVTNMLVLNMNCIKQPSRLAVPGSQPHTDSTLITHPVITVWGLGQKRSSRSCMCTLIS
jgi:hypothetical protein